MEKTHRLLCPQCQQPGMSALRFLHLGPALPSHCEYCGRRIGVPFGRSMLAILPFIAAILGAPFVESLPLRVATVVLGTAAMLGLWFFWVPLEKRG